VFVTAVLQTHSNAALLMAGAYEEKLGVLCAALGCAADAECFAGALYAEAAIAAAVSALLEARGAAEGLVQGGQLAERAEPEAWADRVGNADTWGALLEAGRGEEAELLRVLTPAARRRGALLLWAVLRVHALRRGAAARCPVTISGAKNAGKGALLNAVLLGAGGTASGDGPASATLRSASFALLPAPGGAACGPPALGALPALARVYDTPGIDDVRVPLRAAAEARALAGLAAVHVVVASWEALLSDAVLRQLEAALARRAARGTALLLVCNKADTVRPLEGETSAALAAELATRVAEINAALRSRACAAARSPAPELRAPDCIAAALAPDPLLRPRARAMGLLDSPARVRARLADLLLEAATGEPASAAPPALRARAARAFDPGAALGAPEAAQAAVRRRLVDPSLGRRAALRAAFRAGLRRVGAAAAGEAWARAQLPREWRRADAAAAAALGGGLDDETGWGAAPGAGAGTDADAADAAAVRELANKPAAVRELANKHAAVRELLEASAELVAGAARLRAGAGGAEVGAEGGAGAARLLCVLHEIWDDTEAVFERSLDGGEGTDPDPVAALAAAARPHVRAAMGRVAAAADCFLDGAARRALDLLLEQGSGGPTTGSGGPASGSGGPASGSGGPASGSDGAVAALEKGAALLSAAFRRAVRVMAAELAPGGAAGAEEGGDEWAWAPAGGLGRGGGAGDAGGGVGSPGEGARLRGRLRSVRRAVSFGLLQHCPERWRALAARAENAQPGTAARCLSQSAPWLHAHAAAVEAYAAAARAAELGDLPALRAALDASGALFPWVRAVRRAGGGEASLVAVALDAAPGGAAGLLLLQHTADALPPGPTMSALFLALLAGAADARAQDLPVQRVARLQARYHGFALQLIRDQRALACLLSRAARAAAPLAAPLRAAVPDARWLHELLEARRPAPGRPAWPHACGPARAGR